MPLTTTTFYTQTQQQHELCEHIRRRASTIHCGLVIIGSCLLQECAVAAGRRAIVTHVLAALPAQSRKMSSRTPTTNCVFANPNPSDLPAVVVPIQEGERFRAEGALGSLFSLVERTMLQNKQD